MVETRIQIPDELFKQAKTFAAAKEWSFEEFVRRGMEELLSQSPGAQLPGAEWKPPKPRSLGVPLVSEDQWTELSH